MTLTLVSTEQAARELDCTPKTIRYQLARAAEAGQSIGRKLGPAWALTPDDLPRLREWIESAREKSGFQAGNEFSALRKNPGRPKKSAISAKRNGKRRKHLRTAAGKSGRK